MKTTYGMPYQGSKSRIAEEIIDILPAADNLVDIFAGGCAISHCALLSGKYNQVIGNDISGSSVAFEELINGKPIDMHWVTREEFMKKKDEDPLMAMIWSFGSDCYSYIYSKKTEDFKHAGYEAIVNKNFDPLKENYGMDVSFLGNIDDMRQRRLAYYKYLKQNKDTKFEVKSSVAIPNGGGRSDLQHLQNIDRLQDVQNSLKPEIVASRKHRQSELSFFSIPDTRIESLERIERTNTNFPPNKKKGGGFKSSRLDYHNVVIPDNSIIYCDPPYKGTKGYGKDFNHEEFYDWCLQQDAPVFISSYEMPEDKFECIWSKPLKVLQNAKDNKMERIEKLFIPKK